MNDLLTLNVDGAGSECVTTQKVGADKCTLCGDPIPEGKRKDAKFCSRACQMHSARDMQNELVKEIKMVVKQAAFKYLNRDRYFAFDGRREGPLHQHIKFVFGLRKDKGYHPMPRAVHIEAPAPKFNYVTPEDVDWGKKQGTPAKPMPRAFRNFCSDCIEVVVDKTRSTVRVTKGMYLPIEHECASVRIYDLQGNLIEVKAI